LGARIEAAGVSWARAIPSNDYRRCEGRTITEEQQVAVLRKSSDAWNAWRVRNPEIRPDLSRADLRGANLGGADLRNANLQRVDLAEVSLARANLGGASLRLANLRKTNLSGAVLVGVDLRRAYFRRANLSGADLGGAILERTTLIATDLRNANLSNCCTHGISAWDLKLEGARQDNLVVTPRRDQRKITVDNLEVAQFIYLLFKNEKIRHAIDTITSKVVLILGRFMPERKAVLDAIREELRHRDYLPVLFDFDKPASPDLLGTVETLARMARFVIADITEASSVPAELQAIVPHLRTVPVQPLLRSGAPEYALFAPLKAYPWVLDMFEYRDVAEVLSSLDKIISPAEGMALKLRGVSPPTA
jgi:hypothetical protein